MTVSEQLPHRNTYFCTEMPEVFSLSSTVMHWLEVEAALARAQARLNIIPEAAGAEIDRCALVENVDLDRIVAGQRLTGHPFVPLVQELTAACEQPWGQYVHWGATSQDIMDTGLVLQIREGTSIFNSSLEYLSNQLAELARAHRDTLTMGRTNGQYALPMTLGHRLVGYAAELDRMRDRIEEMKARVEVGQFSGAVGTLASLGENGSAIRDELMKELSLGIPDTSWHSHRDILTEVVMILGAAAQSIGKISDDLYTLLRPEFDEAAERQSDGSVGSSTMPQKRNPFHVMEASALAWLAQGTAAQWMTMPRIDGERDARALLIEGELLPKVFVHSDAAAVRLSTVLDELDFDTDAMEARVRSTEGSILAERVMMRMAINIGRQNAHDLIHRLAGEAYKRREGLDTVLRNDAEVCRHLTQVELDDILEPATYLGTAGRDIDEYLARRSNPNNA